MLWVGCSERTTPGRCRNSSGRMPTQQGLRRTSNTRFSSSMNRHVWVGSSSNPSAKNSIHASRTVSAPPSTGPMDFMEEWIRIVSFPVSPIAARSCLRSAFVYAMSFLLFGRFCLPPVYRLSGSKASIHAKRHLPCRICRRRSGICGVFVLSAFSAKSCIQYFNPQCCRNNQRSALQL